MSNLKFGAFIFALCLLLKSCVCEQTNPCTIQDTIATCNSNENFKSLPDATNVTKLIVRSQELKRIHKDDLAAFINLEEIDLSNSGLEEIDESAFVGLTKLHKINLAGNTKLKIPNDASFIVSNTLTCLNLSNTVVEQLDKTFAHLPLLQNLDLSGTKVKDFSPLKLQEHLAKLVVSKTNETEDLCTILSIKEIIEKDANGVETPLDCKPDVSKDNKEGKDQTTPKIEEPTITEKKIEVTTETATTEATSTAAPKNEETKTEATVSAKIEDQNGLEIAAQNLTKTEDELKIAKIVHESSDMNATTISAVTEEDKNKHQTPANVHESTEKQSTTVATVTKEEPPAENTEEKTTEKIEKPEKNTVTSANTDNAEEDHVTEQPNVSNEDKTEKKSKKKVNDAKDKYATNEKPAVHLEASDDFILPSTANTSQSNGVNIVLGIILCVMIVGAMGFGYKYWKNRRSGYTHANTQDNEDEDKELQTIVAHRTDPDQN